MHNPTDRVLSRQEAAALNLNLALEALVAKLTATCPTCGHSFVFHADSEFGCLDCPIKYAHWWSARVIKNCTWKPR